MNVATDPYRALISSILTKSRSLPRRTSVPRSNISDLVYHPGITPNTTSFIPNATTAAGRTGTPLQTTNQLRSMLPLPTDNSVNSQDLIMAARSRIAEQHGQLNNLLKHKAYQQMYDQQQAALRHQQRQARLQSRAFSNQINGINAQLMAGLNARQAGHSGGGYGPPVGTMPKGDLGHWIMQALRLTGNKGKGYAPGLAQMINFESGGNPNAINNWDSNAAAGTPSKGLMQTIDPTFNSYAIKGHHNIYNPVDNIIAGLRYALSRYGPAMVRAGGRRDSSGHYIGY